MTFIPNDAPTGMARSSTNTIPKEVKINYSRKVNKINNTMESQ